MVTSTMTTTLKADIERDISFVIDWWKSTARVQELRAHWEALDVADFNWREAIDAAGNIVQVDASWTTRDGVAVAVQHRFEAPGSLSSRGTSSRETRYRNGRVGTGVSTTATYFTEPQPGRTHIESTVEYRADGQRLRAKLPGRRRLLLIHLEHEFNEKVARCATA